MKTYVIDITPIPALRMVASDKWAKRPPAIRYMRYKTSLRLLANVAGLKEITGVLSITFTMPIAKSIKNSVRQELIGQPHTQTPDLDNLIKAVKDAICKDDSHVHTYLEMKKVWGLKGKIEITVWEI